MTDSTTATDTNPARHRIERVRHELKRRLLTVKRVARVTPRMVRVTLTGDDLPGFVSAGFDDHVKLFVPSADGTLSMAVPPGEAGGPPMRDFTPRRYDAAANELDIDFAIHDAGPATDWAAKAEVGHQIGVGGPRGSFVIADDFDWYLFVGDETALPAIGRRLDELRPGVTAIVVAEVTDAAEEQQLTSRANVRVTWVHRGAREPGTTTLLDDALRAVALPGGEGYAWVACESLTAKRLRQILVDERGHPRGWIRASGYWRRGAVAVHDNFND